MSRRWNSAAPMSSALGTIAVALAVDYVFGEPPNCVHPVVGMGSLVKVLERLRPKRSAVSQFLWGSCTTVTLCACAAGVALTVTRLTRRVPLWTRIVLHGILLKTLMSAATLERAALRCSANLDAGDLDSARKDLRWLVSRDPSNLEPDEVAAAAIESVAENTSDSIVAPLLAFIFFGLPGAFVYRAVNTLDAMIGYRGEYEYAGKFAARLDDLLNFAPSRLTGALFCLAAGRNCLPALIVMRRDHSLTESPNAGWPMSAAAGSLDISLAKKSHYTLNQGRTSPNSSDIRGVVRLMRTALIIGGAAAGIALLVANMLQNREQKS